MTDADTPRVPDFRWIAGHGLFMPSDDEWIQITDSTGWPLPLWLDWHRLPADAVKLGDVEKLREDLADAERFMQRDRAQAMRATADRDRLRAGIRDLADDLDKVDLFAGAAFRLRKLLDREPGREEPKQVFIPNLADSMAAAGRHEIERIQRAAATGHSDSEAYTNSQNTGDPYTMGPAPAPKRTLLGWTVPDHIVIGTRPDNQITLRCRDRSHALGEINTLQTFDADLRIVPYLQVHAHGQVVEHQPEEGK